MEKLAINGGKPVRDNILPYGRQTIDEDDIEAVVKVLKSDYLTTGPTVGEFEKQLANYCGAKYAVAVANGTAALHACAFAAGIGPGDEVITSPITFAASSNCVLYMGGKPVFADIDENTYNISVDEIKKKITPKTKAIIPVHFTGRPCDMDQIHKIAKEKGLIVIEDAAHAIGAFYKGSIIGGLSDMTILSLHPVKHITTGEGGVILTNSDELYNKLILFRTHGITRNPKLLLENHGGWYYEQQELGYNYRITDIQAGLGISQLHKLNSFIKRRLEIVDIYNKELAGIKGVVLPPKNNEDFKSSWHLYVIWIDPKVFGCDRKYLYDALWAENIGVNVHYLPVYKHPYYQKNGYANVCCEKAERLYDGMISLPMFAGMTDDDVYDTINAIKKIANSIK